MSSISQDTELFKLRLSRGFYAWNIHDVMDIIMKNPNVLSSCGKTLALQKACDMDRTIVSVELIRLLIEEGSKQNFGERGGLRIPTEYGSSPLQILVKRGSLNVLQFLSEEASPPLLCKGDVSNLNLLHFAAGHGHVDVVRFLMKLDPDAIYKRDQNGALPIHMTCNCYKDHTKLHLIRKMLFEECMKRNYCKSNHNTATCTTDEEEKQQEIVPQPNDEEYAMTILECFFPHNVHASKNAVAMYIQDIANIMNCHSVSVPILCAAICVDAPYSHLKCIIDLVHNATFVRDSNNRLPIHHAVERGMSWSKGLKDIVDAHPTAVYEQDCKTYLYPFAAAAAINNRRSGVSCCDLDSIFSLLQKNPESIMN